MSTNTDIARRWASRGYRVFPIVRGKKVPLVHWKDEATSDPDRAEHLFQNGFSEADVGMVIPQDQCVIDLDVKNGVDGIDAWRTHLGYCKSWSFDTMTVTTPSGGMHIYYSTSVPIKNTSNQIAPGIDTRGGGLGFCVAPGCQGYTVEHDPGELLPLPEVIASNPKLHRGRTQENAPRQDADLSHLDPDDITALATRYMEVQKIKAVEEGYGAGNRDVIINRILAGLHGIGVEEDEAGGWINELDAELADGGYEDLERALRSVYRNDTTRAGFGQEFDQRWAEYMAGGGTTQDLDKLAQAALDQQAQAKREAAGEFTWLSCDDLEKLPRVEWLMKGWIPTSSIGLVFGPYGTFKTFMVLDMCLGLAAEGRRVLYVPGEGLNDLQQRVRAWRLHTGRGAPAGFAVCPAVPRIAEPEHFGAFLEACKSQSQNGPVVDLVVFDTMYYAAMGFEENSSKEAMMFLSMLQRGISSVWKDVTLLLIGHTSKGDENELRGSVAIPSAMDFSIKVKRAVDGVSTVRLVKQKAGVDGLERYFETKEVTTGFDEEGQALSTLVVSYEGVRKPQGDEGGRTDMQEAVRKTQADVLFDVIAEELIQRPTETLGMKALVAMIVEEFDARLRDEPSENMDAVRAAVVDLLRMNRKRSGRLAQLFDVCLVHQTCTLMKDQIKYTPKLLDLMDLEPGDDLYGVFNALKLQALDNTR